MSDSLVIDVVRKVVTVDCAVEDAFRVFTADAQSWWPVDTHSIHGDAVREIVFEPEVGGEVYEVATNGEKGHWATVREWEPPHRLVLAWNILEQGEQTEVEVRFLPDGEGARVELEHRGWEQLAERATEKRNDYDTGWGVVLGKFVERM
jgi:uncharacterized protein YndB with AHSA1/START domain